MTEKNIYLKCECNSYFLRKRFEEWIKGTKLSIVNDCYVLILNNGFLNETELADMYFLDNKILVKVDEEYFNFVKKIFKDFSNETKTNVTIRIKQERESYY